MADAGTDHDVAVVPTDDAWDRRRRSARSGRDGRDDGAACIRSPSSEPVAWLLKALFALRQRHAPYHEYLGAYHRGVTPAGWDAAELERTLVDVARTAEPALQQSLETCVEALMDEFGITAHRNWDATLEQLERARF